MAKHALPTGQEKTRAQRLKPLFNIDIKTCEQCGGAVKIVASIDKSPG
jgi:hypothetical protein